MSSWEPGSLGDSNKRKLRLEEKGSYFPPFLSDSDFIKDFSKHSPQTVSKCEPAFGERAVPCLASDPDSGGNCPPKTNSSVCCSIASHCWILHKIKHWWDIMLSKEHVYWKGMGNKHENSTLTLISNKNQMCIMYNPIISISHKLSH